MSRATGTKLSGLLALAVPALLAAFLAGPAPATAQTTVYLAFGDSITVGVGESADAEPRGYPGRLERMLNNAGMPSTVLNRGVGAENTAEGLSRIDSVLSPSQDVLLLMEGSNDISNGLSRETTISNLQAMAVKAERLGLEVYHATLIPRIPRAREDPENITNQRRNEYIRDLAGRMMDRKLVDNFEVFGDLSNLFAEYYSSNPEDFVGHPNADGYDVMAQTFFDVIVGDDEVAPVTGILTPATGARRVSRTQRLVIDLWDFGAGIDLANTELLVNDQVISAAVSGGTRRASLVYSPTTPWRGVVRVRLRSRDLATPANTQDQEIMQFTVDGTTFLDGDIDRDGRVDGADLVDFGRRFGAVRGDGLYHQRADIDNNQVIDGEDFAVLAQNFGKSSF